MQFVLPRRNHWLILVGSAVLFVSSACGTPGVPQSQATASLAPTAVVGPTAVADSVPASPPASSTAASSSVTQPPLAITVAPPEPATASATTVSAASPTEATLAPFDPALAAQLQRILDETVADGSIPGAVVSVSIPGQAPWTGASGIADRRQRLPMQPTTNVRIASLSKMFTAVVVLQLVQEGKIDLNAALTTYVPDLVPNGNAITVRNLLQHTTGLYDFLEDRNFVAQAYQNPQRTWKPAELVAYATQFPPAFRAGAPGAWDYSSTNYVLLGMIVERVTGKSLAQEMRQRIFDPLRLEGTFFAPDEPMPPTLARGYSRSVDQTNVAMSFAYATANLVSTADDVRRFILALVNDDLLQPETRSMMFTFVNGKGQYYMPALEYGLGIMRNRLPVGPGPNGQARPPEASTVVGHIGGFGGFRAAVWSAPASGITIALGVNQAATDPNTLATRVFDAILTQQGQ